MTRPSTIVAFMAATIALIGGTEASAATPVNNQDQFEPRNDSDRRPVSCAQIKEQEQDAHKPSPRPKPYADQELEFDNGDVCILTFGPR